MLSEAIRGPFAFNPLSGALRSPFELGVGGFNPSSLYTGGAAGLWLDPSDSATVFQESTGTTAGVLDSPVGLRLDRRFGATSKTDPGNHVLQATSAARPTWKLDGSIYSDLMDGVDDGYSTAAFAAGTLTANMDCFIAVKRNSTASGIACASAAGFFGCWEAGSGAAPTSTGTPGHYVDGVQIGAFTRDALHTALGAGTWRVLEVRGLDLSAWGGFGVSNYGAGFFINGNIGGVILCPAQSDEKRAQIRKYLGNKVGLSL